MTITPETAIRAVIGQDASAGDVRQVFEYLVARNMLQPMPSQIEAAAESLGIPSQLPIRKTQWQERLTGS